MTRPIPLARPAIGELEIDEVVDALRGGELASGARCRRFESDLARAIGVPHAIATASASAALGLGLAALGIGPGHDVVLSTLATPGTAYAIIRRGARPVLVDVDVETMNLDPAAIDAAVTSRTRAVLAVHHAGRMCDMPGLLRLCTNRGLHLVEDADDGIGAAFGGRAAGAWGDIGAFSFRDGSNLSTGEGGMLTTDSDDVHARALAIRPHGHDVPMSDLQAAVGIHQLARLDELLDARHQLAVRYDAGLAGHRDIKLPAAPAPGMVHAHQRYVIRISRAARRDRDVVRAGLSARDIETAVPPTPLHMLPEFQEAYGYRAAQFPRAEVAAREALALPLYPGMLDDDQERVIDSLVELMG